MIYEEENLLKTIKVSGELEPDGKTLGEEEQEEVNNELKERDREMERLVIAQVLRNAGVNVYEGFKEFC